MRIADNVAGVGADIERLAAKIGGETLAIYRSKNKQEYSHLAPHLWQEIPKCKPKQSRFSPWRPDGASDSGASSSSSGSDSDYVPDLQDRLNDFYLRLQDNYSVDSEEEREIAERQRNSKTV